MKQKINPVAAGIVIAAVLGVVGYFIYTFTEPPMVDLPVKSQAQIAAEAKQKMEGMRSALNAMARERDAKQAKQAAGEQKNGAKSHIPPQSEQSAKPNE